LVTYCATGPALCLLEKLVHVEDTGLLPDDTMLIRYDVPDDLRVEESRVVDLPEEWRADQQVTRSIGSAWLDRVSACLLRVPSVIVPIPDADDRNVLVNHRHRDVARITISRVEQFEYDPRLLAGSA
jgi:RES domain-containing protein